ncbi:MULTISPECIES: KdsC family phosphatase [Sphingobacterium]|uniref:HAD-IIIA family hydrolase n=1 Tax=Sphingobacterium litopenaei TaxID=2763500 RepID=A0ABR7YHX3_9SPHI|nr:MULTISPECIES: HAD-IIIA family hydrolase [Sphingobacterium]MBD1430861.1 HAD-IIIA family hydrolase [Sphingobacterium litopenaei]NGM74590.1 HAD-IIIA family hydrolase [Sphingobacterium sp. SGL-16]
MIYTKLKSVKCVVLDVDGVLTNGDILVTEEGNQLRTFNVKDGYAIQYAIKQGVDIFVITGAKSQGVKLRFEGLGVKETFLGISDKWTLLRELLEKYDYNTEEVLFVGDDMPDYICMQKVGIAVSPADAVEDIKKVSSYVSKLKGGEGVVREILEKLLRLQGKWHVDVLTPSV